MEKPLSYEQHDSFLNETSAEPDIAALASLITVPARAAILAHLLDGRSWTGKELASAAAIGASTASVHLQMLVRGGLIHVNPVGRHRYFRIAKEEVARLLEQLAQLAPTKSAKTPGAKRAALSLRRCRLCYDHLAGTIGVSITSSMVRQGWIVEAEPWYRLTNVGHQALDALDIEAVDGRMCMDWSERRLHLAGKLGERLARAFLDRNWMRRDPKSRAVWITPEGAESIRTLFGDVVAD